MGERYQTTDACELALHSCAPLRRGGENGGIGKSQHAYACLSQAICTCSHVLCTYELCSAAKLPSPLAEHWQCAFAVGFARDATLQGTCAIPLSRALGWDRFNSSPEAAVSAKPASERAPLHPDLSRTRPQHVGRSVNIRLYVVIRKSECRV